MVKPVSIKSLVFRYTEISTLPPFVVSGKCCVDVQLFGSRHPDIKEKCILKLLHLYRLNLCSEVMLYASSGL